MNVNATNKLSLLNIQWIAIEFSIEIMILVQKYYIFGFFSFENDYFRTVLNFTEYSVIPTEFSNLGSE